MQVFLHEFLTSGALADLPPSLLREGRAMWQAVATDLASLRNVCVVTTRDRRVAPLGIAGVTEVEIADASREAAAFSELCRSADLTCLIAPELDGELQRRIDLAVASGCGRLLNAIDLPRTAGDKWLTFEVLTRAGVPTVPTSLLVTDRDLPRFPVVIKPRDGAGSQGIAIAMTARELDGWRDRENADRWIIQPLIEGPTWSCCALFGASGRLVEVLPPVEQLISPRTFEFLGGQIPAAGQLGERIQALTLQAIQALERECCQPLIGPVGVDFVQTREGAPLVVDVNPRFTTSYVGYRALAESNLMEPMLELDVAPIRWKTGRVRFDPSGGVAMQQPQSFAE